MINHYNCIYMYINKINGKRYIGQAKDFEIRHNTHVRKSANKTPIDRAIKKYGINNFEIIILKENVKNQCLLNLYECYYINKYNTLINNDCGYNICNGGSNGNPFYGKTEEEMREIKKHMSESAKKKIFTEEHRKNLCESKKGEKNHNYGKAMSEEQKQKISKSKKGQKLSNETRNKMSESKSITVIQYDINNNIIKIWKNAKEASIKLNLDDSSIRKCCNGKRKTCGGFIWKYYKEGDINER